MNDPQIEALARVYAEVMNPVDDYSEVSIIYERPIDMDIDYDSAKRFLTWLSQRYCIVEKEALSKWIDPKDKLPEIRERVLICEKVANQYKVFIGKRVPFNNGWEYNQSEKENVVAWMPLPKYSLSIAKEMEE